MPSVAHCESGSPKVQIFAATPDFSGAALHNTNKSPFSKQHAKVKWIEGIVAVCVDRIHLTLPVNQEHAAALV
jgi:hypothetical protein